MKRKNVIRMLEILCIISIIITVFSIQRTYAKYFEKVDTTYQTYIKRWLINVNSHNIHEKQTLSEVMQPILVADENVNSNVLVPGRTGYFEMLIDYSSVDLAFEYEFTIEQLNKEQLPDFEIYGYEVIDGANRTITETNQIKGVIDPTTEVNSLGEKKREIRVLFRWNDNNNNIMNNMEDTQFRGETVKNTSGGTGENPETGTGTDLHTILKYKATMKFTQYIEPKVTSENLG